MARRARRDASIALAVASPLIAMLALEACRTSSTESSIVDGGGDVSSPDVATALDAAPADAAGEAAPADAAAASPEAGTDAEPDGDASADAADAASSEDCVPESPGKCGPNPLCCPARNGELYDAVRNCIDITIEKAISCDGLTTPFGCVVPGLIVGCVTGDAGTYFMSSAGLGPGFVPCPPELYNKVADAPACP